MSKGTFKSTYTEKAGYSHEPPANMKKNKFRLSRQKSLYISYIWNILDISNSLFRISIQFFFLSAFSANIDIIYIGPAVIAIPTEVCFFETTSVGFNVFVVMLAC